MPAEVTLRANVRSGLLWSAVSHIGLRAGSLLMGIVLARLLSPENTCAGDSGGSRGLRRVKVRNRVVREAVERNPEMEKSSDGSRVGTS